MILSVINLKGGCGKTTTAMAIATAAQRDGRDVTVYDADPQASASTWSLDAEDAGCPLPFDVMPANVATMRALRKRDDDGTWSIVDCPPSGTVVDEAMQAATVVIVPTTPAPADMRKTIETAQTLEAAGVTYAILITRAASRTLTLREAVSQIEEAELSAFDAQVPQREALKAVFGRSFDDGLHGYEAVYRELVDFVEGE